MEIYHYIIYPQHDIFLLANIFISQKHVSLKPFINQLQHGTEGPLPLLQRNHNPSGK